MFIRNIFQWVGKTEALFMPKRQSIGSLKASFSSATTKVTEITSSKLDSMASLNASQAHSIQASEAESLMDSHHKTPLKESPQENPPKQPAKKDVSWLKPFIMKGIIDSEAERKFSASFDKGWVSNPLDFIHLDVEKASCDDLADLIPLLNRGILIPETEKKIHKKFDDDTKTYLALKYANPELDRLIELNHGRIENIEDFDMYELRHRANIGVLDKETARKAYDRVYAYDEQRTKEYLEDEDFSDYSEYGWLGSDEEVDQFSKK